MAKYHINPKTGQPGRCTAKEGNCLYGSLKEEHYSSAAEARAAYESKQVKTLPPSRNKRSIMVAQQGRRVVVEDQANDDLEMSALFPSHEVAAEVFDRLSSRDQSEYSVLARLRETVERDDFRGSAKVPDGGKDPETSEGRLLIVKQAADDYATARKRLEAAYIGKQRASQAYLANPSDFTYADFTATTTKFQDANNEAQRALTDWESKTVELDDEHFELSRSIGKQEVDLEKLLHQMPMTSPEFVAQNEKLIRDSRRRVVKTEQLKDRFRAGSPALTRI